MAHESKVIKTYLSFSQSIDPANLKTLVDLDLSYALTSTLVDWTDSRTLKAGLAKPLDPAGEKEITFKIRPDAKWSDGSEITAAQVVKSFDRAGRLYGEELKSLFEIIEKIEAKDASTVVFRLNRPIAESLLLHKLTEPMYGVVFVRDDGELDLKKTCGAFFLKEKSAQEITLVANPFWYGRQSGMAEMIVIRQPKTDVKGDQDDFVGDPWPNLVASSSLMPAELESRYKKEHFSIWNRNLDRVFFFSPSTRLTNPEGRKLFQAFTQKLDRKLLLKGLSGYYISQQFFPPGYPIFDPKFAPLKTEIEVPDTFKKKPLELLGADGRVGDLLRANVISAIKQLTGHEPHFTTVPLSEFEQARGKLQYDILVGSLPVNDPNVEGAISFFFGLMPPLIPNVGEGSGDFKKRIVEARAFDEKKRNNEYRKVFSDAIVAGSLLPLFHFSSIVVAREGIDLSRVPTTDETVAFAKVRFR